MVIEHEHVRRPVTAAQRGGPARAGGDTSSSSEDAGRTLRQLRWSSPWRRVLGVAGRCANRTRLCGQPTGSRAATRRTLPRFLPDSDGVVTRGDYDQFMINARLTKERAGGGRRHDRPGRRAILPLLRRYPYVTAVTVQRLRYGRGSLSYVRLKLRLLDAAGFLTRSYPRGRRTRQQPGRLPARRAGRRRCDRPAVPVAGAPRGHATMSAASCSWRRALAAIDVLIAAELLTRHDARLRLARLLTEPRLRRRPRW